jgi:hypothetical protein
MSSGSSGNVASISGGSMLNLLCKVGWKHISLGKACKSGADRLVGCSDRFRNRFTVALQEASTGAITKDELLSAQQGRLQNCRVDGRREMVWANF